MSSWRLFETLKAGRVPVIISDQWVPPEGPAWESFSVRVPERNVAAIPTLLERLEPRAAEMGCQARRAYEHWFAAETAFHTVVGACLEILAIRRVPEAWGRWPTYLQLLRPHYFRHQLCYRLAQTINGKCHWAAQRSYVGGERR